MAGACRELPAAAAAEGLSEEAPRGCPDWAWQELGLGAGVSPAKATIRETRVHKDKQRQETETEEGRRRKSSNLNSVEANSKETLLPSLPQGGEWDRVF